jgi:hypothetical protein
MENTSKIKAGAKEQREIRRNQRKKQARKAADMMKTAFKGEPIKKADNVNTLRQNLTGTVSTGNSNTPPTQTPTPTPTPTPTTTTTRIAKSKSPPAAAPKPKSKSKSKSKSKPKSPPAAAPKPTPTQTLTQTPTSTITSLLAQCNNPDDNKYILVGLFDDHCIYYDKQEDRMHNMPVPLPSTPGDNTATIKNLEDQKEILENEKKQRELEDRIKNTQEQRKKQQEDEENRKKDEEEKKKADAEKQQKDASIAEAKETRDYEDQKEQKRREHEEKLKNANDLSEKQKQKEAREFKAAQEKEEREFKAAQEKEEREFKAEQARAKYEDNEKQRAFELEKERIKNQPRESERNKEKDTPRNEFIKSFSHKDFIGDFENKILSNKAKISCGNDTRAKSGVIVLLNNLINIKVTEYINGLNLGKRFKERDEPKLIEGAKKEILSYYTEHLGLHIKNNIKVDVNIANLFCDYNNVKENNTADTEIQNNRIKFKEIIDKIKQKGTGTRTRTRTRKRKGGGTRKNNKYISK